MNKNLIIVLIISVVIQSVYSAGGNCPDGSVISDGVTPNWVTSVTECTMCRANYYHASSNWISGDLANGKCIECTDKKSDSIATLGPSATKDKMCFGNIILTSLFMTIAAFLI